MFSDRIPINLFKKMVKVADGPSGKTPTAEQIAGKKERAHDPTDLVEVNNQIQEIVRGEKDPQNALKKIMAYFGSLDDFSASDDLLDIYVTFDISLTKKEERHDREGSKVKFRVVIDNGRLILLPITRVNRGFAMLDAIAEQNK